MGFWYASEDIVPVSRACRLEYLRTPHEGHKAFLDRVAPHPAAHSPGARRHFLHLPGASPNLIAPRGRREFAQGRRAKLVHSPWCASAFFTPAGRKSRSYRPAWAQDICTGAPREKTRAQRRLSLAKAAWIFWKVRSPALLSKFARNTETTRALKKFPQRCQRCRIFPGPHTSMGKCTMIPGSFAAEDLRQHADYTRAVQKFLGGLESCPSHRQNSDAPRASAAPALQAAQTQCCAGEPEIATPRTARRACQGCLRAPEACARQLCQAARAALMINPGREHVSCASRMIYPVCVQRESAVASFFNTCRRYLVLTPL